MRPPFETSAIFRVKLRIGWGADEEHGVYAASISANQTPGIVPMLSLILSLKRTESRAPRQNCARLGQVMLFSH
jgi:hypothetical protein